jgi:dienelactone hydrolase
VSGDPLSQTEIAIPLGDGRTSFSLLNQTGSGHFVIYLHGLASHPGRTLPFYLAQELAGHGFDVLRLGQYDTRDGARQLIDCTLATHVADLHTAIVYVQQQYQPKTLHLIGHSFGGQTILAAKAGVTSAILLDPSHPSVNPFRNARHVKELDAYLRASGGLEYLVGPAMVKEFEATTETGLTNGYHTPSLIITAGASVLAKSGTLYAKALQDHTLTKQVTIAGADHSFNTPTHLAAVAKHSLGWLQEHTK